MLTQGTYKLPDSEFKAQRISLNLKSVKIWPYENKTVYSDLKRGDIGGKTFNNVCDITQNIIVLA